MPRDLSEFKGDAIIIGGGWCKNHCTAKPPIRNPDNFYTVDIDENAQPDAVLDITDEAQCSIIPEKRFSLVYFECFPFYLGERQLQKAFSLAHRFLKPDGVLIYRGGSDKSVSSIPEILKNAGFLYAFKKALDPEDPKTKNDNGSISLAANIDTKLIQENFSILSGTMQYYLTHYKFFSPEPFSTHSFRETSSIKFQSTEISIPRYGLNNTSFNFNRYNHFLNQSNLIQKDEQDLAVIAAKNVSTTTLPTDRDMGKTFQLSIFPIVTSKQNKQNNIADEFKPGFSSKKDF